MKSKRMTQSGPFRARIPEAYKKDLLNMAKQFGTHYGIMFDTSGKVHTEHVNYTRKYDYLWSTESGKL